MDPHELSLVVLLVYTQRERLLWRVWQVLVTTLIVSSLVLTGFLIVRPGASPDATPRAVRHFAAVGSVRSHA